VSGETSFFHETSLSDFGSLLLGWSSPDLQALKLETKEVRRAFATTSRPHSILRKEDRARRKPHLRSLDIDLACTEVHRYLPRPADSGPLAKLSGASLTKG